MSCPAAYWHTWVPTHRWVRVVADGQVYEMEQYRCLHCGRVSPS